MGLKKKIRKVGKRVGKAAAFAATGGLSDDSVRGTMTGGLSGNLDYIEDGFNEVTGVAAAQRAQERALAGLEGNIAEGQALSEVGTQQQLDSLDQTYGDQRGQYQSALGNANNYDQQALNQYMQAQQGNINNISGMLDPQAALQGQFMGSVADASTLDGYGNMLNDVRNSDTYNSLLGERMGAAQNQFADAGLRRSTTAGEQSADIAQNTLLDLGNQNYNRQMGMLNMGNQGVMNQANYLGNANTNLNNMNMNQQNMMNQRGYGNAMGVGDLIGDTGVNRRNLMGANTSNQMNLLGQLGQAQAASQIAQGKNTMNTRMGLLGAGANVLGGAFTGGFFN